MTDVILLHGSWHQPAHFDELAELLRSRGLNVEVPDLYELTVDEGTALVQSIVDAAERPPLVVGHSFGGVVAGTVQGAQGQIFLAGWLLDVGESPAQLLEQLAKETGVAPEGLALTPDADGRLAVAPAEARTNLYGDVDDATAARAIALLRPEPPAIFDASPAKVTWHDTPTTYVVCSNDKTVSAALAERFAARCTTTETWPTSHSPFLSQPEKVAEFIHQRRV
ncbi:alpha/beta hydrolase [Kribbella antibiotica]|uniref:Alpha/beta hydrolase n=1 Tax=Kribbella antibiotica TaxID=190195 RepID=A0A4R4ZVM0_9ACTN|nr:alpha/beta hydrolase [Kribbella antibiotica]TDD63223.1 alpha/beta hydrolase [Kribbella antibiotica]